MVDRRVQQSNAHEPRGEQASAGARHSHLRATPSTVLDTNAPVHSLKCPPVSPELRAKLWMTKN
eukprot:5152421-Alexandrium_andersonii.AAC.1